MTTGRKLDNVAHLRQSIKDILTTPLGTRLMQPDYGSRLFDLIDTPFDNRRLLLFYNAVFEALMTWEPRLVVTTMKAEMLTPGHVTLTLSGIYTINGQLLTIEGLVI